MCYTIFTSGACEDLGNIENGFVNVNSPIALPGEMAEFSCRSGYVLDGHSTTYCKADLTWSHPLSQCIEPVEPGKVSCLSLPQDFVK